MIKSELLAKAVKLAQKGLSTSEISEKLTIDIHQLRMLFTELRKAKIEIPHNRRSKKRKLIEETKKRL